MLRAAAGPRHAIVPEPQITEPAAADLPVVNAGIPLGDPAAGWSTAAGGAGWDAETACAAAIGEALERYCALAGELPTQPRALVAGRALHAEDFSLFDEAQRARGDFPYRALYDDHELPYLEMTDAATHKTVWVPAALAVFSHAGGAAPATSSGLAAGVSPMAALQSAVQELIERDALMVTWLHGVAGREVVDAVPPAIEELVRQRGGSLRVFDITPVWSPYPVAVAAGGLPLRGRMRYSLGAASRQRWSDAVEKAILEWAQGTVFAGIYTAQHPGIHFPDGAAVRTFEDHAAYYTVHPERWNAIPLLRAHPAPAPAEASRSAATRAAVRILTEHLAGHGIQILWRDITTPDVRQAGVSVVRASSPQLAQIHCDERWPHLGGRTADLRRRYPDAVPLTPFPSPHPHPLG